LNITVHNNPTPRKISNEEDQSNGKSKMTVDVEVSHEEVEKENKNQQQQKKKTDFEFRKSNLWEYFNSRMRQITDMKLDMGLAKANIWKYSGSRTGKILGAGVLAGWPGRQLPGTGNRGTLESPARFVNTGSWQGHPSRNPTTRSQDQQSLKANSEVF
jgi:hypothetical protein